MTDPEHELHRLQAENAILATKVRNFEALDGLLHAISGVLDVREVFASVSAIAHDLLPHDALSIAEVVDDGRKVRVHASHGLGPLPPRYEYPIPDQAMTTDPWNYRLIGDVRQLPEFAHHPATRAGMLSMLFVSIRLEGRHFGGLNFYARTAHRYTEADAALARRIADLVALGLSHARLAETARLNTEQAAKATNVDLLDQLLASMAESGEIGEVFERMAGVAAHVLPLDASAITVRLPDGIHARIVASTGFPDDWPKVTEIPDDLLASTNWDHHIFDDLQGRPQPRYVRLAAFGIQSLMRVPVRLEGEFAGALVFFSRRPAAYRAADVPIARRIADRLAVIMARDREVAASRRADEANERAARLEARVRELTDELDARSGYRRVVGDSPTWRDVLKQAAQVAETNTTVLLLGESGTGKEVIARLLHRGSSRAKGPFIALNCAALPEQLLEAELFGYERGAYTGATTSKPGQLEQASGGTLFLDEVGEMSPSSQAKFLRVLQEREFQRLGGTRVLKTDARIVAATNRDLLRSIAAGQFREDLYYRLNVFAIRLPPLRDRREDIVPLSEVFLVEISHAIGRPPVGLSREARELLVAYHWPGNVRELRNMLERAAILCDTGIIGREHLSMAPAPLPVRTPAAEAPTNGPSPAIPAASAGAAVPGGTDLTSMERAMITDALANARYNKSKAAKALGLTRHQLYIRLRRHGLE